ncbi:tRNA (adenosine(37)-N6)-dimethylallyltransferase MiaA [Atopobium fossor]|uniref:tRNA (adenosine(37)-N6)-dimethylallyltransferase MiaA n=1 Tax=Atopobium fossor TaxID=39487 RepID=UPI0004093D47|nr:tRNA (adenosine(37)-N6)-dimethylallyltransferase MiaA [Atopobium fossor]
MTNPVVCIVGPTASGKSALADLLAEHFCVPVISVDAMQVYRGMDIGTAKTPIHKRRVELQMVDVCDVNQNYSVDIFQKQARHCVDTLLSEKRQPILCGGTGLYLDAVIDEMNFPSGDVQSLSREKYTRYVENEGKEALYALLQKKDPASAQEIHPNNIRRIIRALELCDQGQSYASIHKGLLDRKSHYSVLIFGLTRNREELYRRIDERVDLMFEQGLVDEVQGLLNRGLRNSKTAYKAIGYKEIIDAFEGLTSIDEARKRIKMHTRRYAKRQLSWLRRDKRTIWLSLDELSQQEAFEFIVYSIKQWKRD